ncbi:MAG: hypothetical protein UY41_C0034G0003 [Candidatus Moranbacteria bacterium GW2011_GWE1_49_15]|nr:MAG: hypothetical protein UY41_C0034G0003 [Candidatus Moranbacteria bacterium GW2011_GWE1_49_15]
MDAAKKALEVKRKRELENSQSAEHPGDSAFAMLENSVRENEDLARKKREREKIRIEFIAIARELSELQEGLPFCGIDADSYLKLKADDEDFPGFVTPIDELIARFEKEGMKVVFGTDPLGSNVFISPFEMADNEYDGIKPEQLRIDENMDERLKKLIFLHKAFPRQN